MTMYGQRCIVLETQGPSTALQIHFVNPQGCAQDDNVRTKVHRFRNARSFDCAADSLRESAGSAQDDNVGQRLTVFETQGPSTAPADSLREPAGSAQDDNVRTKILRLR